MNRSQLTRLGVAIVAGVLASLLTTTSTTQVASAQAEIVRVVVRVEPESPAPGDDVSVKVRVRGCPPGDARVEAYLSTSDGASQVAALMGRAPLITTMFFQAHATIALPQAIEGWYGVRVVCGSFKPARVPMPNTTFAVGAKPDKTSRLIGTSVIQGEKLRLEGNGCPGTQVEYQVIKAGLGAGGFTADGSIATNADATWGGDITFPGSLSPGAAEVRSRCVVTNRYGDIVTINYGERNPVTILSAPATTVAPTTVPTVAPTTPPTPAGP